MPGPEQTVVVVGAAAVGHAYRVAALPFPGEVALAKAGRRVLGGSGANQAAAARALGAETIFVGCVGDDEAGHETEADLRALGVDLRLRRVSGAPTGTAVSFVDDEGQIVGVGHPGANFALGPDDITALGSALTSARVCLAGGAVPAAVVKAALEAAGAREEGARILDLALPDPELVALFGSCEVVVTDSRTAEGLLAVGIADVDDALAALRGLKDEGARDPILFLGPAGAVCFDRGRTTHVPIPASEVRDPSAVDDAFKGALAALLAEGLEVAEAVDGACGYASLALAVEGGRSAFPDRAAFDALRPED